MDFIVRNTLKCSSNYCRPNFKQLQFPSYNFMHQWYNITIFGVCEIRTANLFWRDILKETEKWIFYPLIPTYVLAKVMWIDIRKNLIPQRLSIFMRNNWNTYKKWQKENQAIFSITVLIIYFPHVRYENKKDQTEEQRNINRDKIYTDWKHRKQRYNTFLLVMNVFKTILLYRLAELGPKSL